MGIAESTPGNKYTDSDSNTDKIAVGGIAAVIGGKVLAKAGILAGLGKFLKLIILGIGALIAGVIRFFKGKKQDESYAYEPAPPADNSTPNA